ncbi:hypothetical protein AWB67_05626 [Caballeronia terrestris]|uniref:Uncharacterized protein n=1 Tax=Caballeronia terrestris TaxID=1226301 RepID=A0A158KJ61_9BURK|nr:hypothetical protein AWB67_05626 [Caballeronia terrestris]
MLRLLPPTLLLIRAVWGAPTRVFPWSRFLWTMVETKKRAVQTA